MQEKKIFDTNEQSSTAEENLQAKREFHSSQIAIDEQAYQEQNQAENELRYALQRPLSWWQKGLIGTTSLFALAVIAQAIQWLIDAWQQHQWIDFAFALVFSGIVTLGFSAVINELRHLRQLKKLALLQQQNHAIQNTTAHTSATVSAKEGEQLTQQLAQYMQLSVQDPRYQRWQHYANQGYTAQELLRLFSEEFLQPIDLQAQKIINKQAIESAVIVAISPLALVDMCFVAWRHLRLINKLAKLYGVKLGYFSRIRLIKMVLFNIAFAGATDLIREVGMEWFSQDLTAKLSARAAQGVGVGLLTARLGIKTMELCRPVPFTSKERPKLHTVHKLLLNEVKNVIKDNIFSANKSKEYER
ncbi:YcjF family protein [Gallibacterium sp. AGMB14963]|uniref:YcjF family protein n=1 Tax=Gallibacterium faecale TaxID=3019086 RepID=UPI0022F17AA7|nr:TIGR01620 family protein [Gallibacterium sp. AGMB14963]MDA3978620.1 TIGR01620 family protein [Gallibacterium sp. AGMB14963]